MYVYVLMYTDRQTDGRTLCVVVVVTRVGRKLFTKLKHRSHIVNDLCRLRVSRYYFFFCTQRKIKQGGFGLLFLREKKFGAVAGVWTATPVASTSSLPDCNQFLLN